MLASCFVCGFPALPNLFPFDRMYFIKITTVTLKSHRDEFLKSSAVLFLLIYFSKIRRPSPFPLLLTVPFFPLSAYSGNSVYKLLFYKSNSGWLHPFFHLWLCTVFENANLLQSEQEAGHFFTLMLVLLFGKLAEHELNLSSMQNSVWDVYKFV